MDPSTDVLADKVRATRHAVDNDLELLRVKAQRMDPRRHLTRWRAAVPPLATGAAAYWLWRRKRRSVVSLRGLLVNVLSDLYRTEHRLVPALERMRKAASNPDLATLFGRHAAESEAHIERLDRVLRSVGASPAGGTSTTVAAIENEGSRLLKGRVDAGVRDAWLIAMAQQAEHFEIATYGTARTFAETLGYTYAAQLLQQTLEEERAMDEQLTRVAERFVNPETLRSGVAARTNA
jgi:ferritin-like metal-binding protein YciE